jgi:Zn-dependent protease with chaperone function
MGTVTTSESEYRRNKRQHEEYVSRIKSLEQFAKEKPREYRRKVFRLAMLGYFVVFGLLGIAIGMLIGTIYLMIVSRHVAAFLKIGLVVGAFSLIILRALLVRPPRPQGLVVKRRDAPRLFEVLDDLAKKLKAPKMHRVIIVDDFNAYAAQWPRLGILGWYENTLGLGLPYMMAMTTPELTAVIAHELGHFSGRHGRMGTRIYKLHEAWGAIYANSNGWGGGIIRAFLRWYMPLFNAYTFAFRRGNEYEADEASVKACGVEASTTDLMRAHPYGHMLYREFWPEIYRMVEQSPYPPAGVYRKMLERLGEPLDTEEVKKQLKESFAEETGYDDTHPCLRDRLAAMGSLPKLETEEDWDELARLVATPAKPSAAEELLGPHLETVIRKLDEEWRSERVAVWRERHAQCQKWRSRLQELAEKEKVQTLSEEELLERADLIKELEGREPALAALAAVIDRYPENAQANFVLGYERLDEDEEAAKAMLETAARNDPSYREAVYQILTEHAEKQGRLDAAEKYYGQYQEQSQASENAAKRLLNPSKQDTFIGPSLPQAEVAKLREQLARYKSVAAAYLVRNPAVNSTERTFHLLVLDPVQTVLATSERQADRTVEEVQHISLPTDTLAIVISDQKWLRKRLSNMPEARIYARHS